MAIPAGYKLRPVEAVQTWLAAAEISTGPVFRAVTRGGRVSWEALADEVLVLAADIINRQAPIASAIRISCDSERAPIFSMM